MTDALTHSVPPDDDVRFGFGDNWRTFIDRLNDDRIAEAERSLKSLLGLESLRGLTFLDIGSGSGLFSLAARRLGARVRSFDYDPASVDCALTLRERFFPGEQDWLIDRGSILDEHFMRLLGSFDIVYSWGVLHHTGAMYRAIEQAASRVKPGGLFAFALYRKTRMCFAWMREKRWYANASPNAQRAARAVFVTLLHLAFALRGRGFKYHVANYSSARGMDFETDVHDWMGGYPYESIRPAEVDALMKRLDFSHVRSNTQPYTIGFFGSGCDEFVYRRGGGRRVMPEPASAKGFQVLLVTGSLERGGTEQHLVAMASALLRRGWRVEVFSLANGPLARELETNGVPLILARGRLGSGRGFSPQRLIQLALAAAHLLAVMLSRRPAIVHFFLPETYLLGAPLAILAHLPLRVMSRRSLNLYQRGYPDFVARLERRLHCTMTAILGNSRSVVRELREREGVDPRRLGLIYNGVDMARFGNRQRRAMRDALGLPPNALVLVTVANLIPYKGHHDLLRALGAVKAQLPNGWRLLLVGRDDGIQRDLQAEADALAISDHVSFLGSRGDAPDILEAGDIGILCSHQEGFSNAVLEGMAAGLAMVVTDVGGNPEAVIDGESGLVVPPRNPARLADAILRVVGDEALRERLGAAARARVTAEFSFARCVERYDALYHALLAGRLPQDLPDIWAEAR